MKKSLKGFTLVEMLIVISIIAILSGAILAGMGSSRAKARNAKKVADMNNLAIIVENNYANGAYPVDSAALESLEGVDGSKATLILNDPDITYCTQSDNASYRIAGVLEPGADATATMANSLTSTCNTSCGVENTFCIGE